MIAAMAYETGIAPNDLLDAPPGVLEAMLELRRDLIRQQAKQAR